MGLLIGFGNKARHGKDSAANAILNNIEDHNAVADFSLSSSTVISAQTFKFAEALYEECRRDHGMTEKDAPLLQRVGASRREENENYWIDQVFKKVDAFYNLFPCGVAIITDVRYKNEATEIKRRGGYLINVTRLNGDSTPYVAWDRPANHPSEIDLDGYDWDFYIKTKTGEEHLAADQAITIFTHIRILRFKQ